MSCYQAGLYNCDLTGPSAYQNIPGAWACVDPGLNQTLPVGHYQEQFSAFQTIPTTRVPAPGVVPLPIINGINGTGCDNCLKTLAAADAKLDACLRFNPVLPNGTTIPAAVINTPECKSRIYDSWQRCGFHCNLVPTSA